MQAQTSVPFGIFIYVSFCYEKFAEGCSLLKKLVICTFWLELVRLPEKVEKDIATCSTVCKYRFLI